MHPWRNRVESFVLLVIDYHPTDARDSQEHGDYRYKPRPGCRDEYHAFQMGGQRAWHCVPPCSRNHLMPVSVV